jgi:2-keto-4-pentenoate hydratase/2-oxohepta-3-ene-1,7-dioic acid hydratase in catechol pathway
MVELARRLKRVFNLDPTPPALPSRSERESMQNLGLCRFLPLLDLQVGIPSFAWQLQDGSLWRAKNSDTFKPMGPWIATDLDPNNLETTIRINGQVQIQFNTRHMLFDAASHIAKISRYSTLYPGDVVWLGAEGATPNMRPGDVVEIEISGIGTLRNYVVAEE